MHSLIVVYPTVTVTVTVTETVTLKQAHVKSRRREIVSSDIFVRQPGTTAG